MSTLTYPAVGVSRASRAETRRLYFGTAVMVAFIAFLGFTPSFWMPFSAGTLELHPALHIHAVLFFLWPLFFVVQTALVAHGRTAWHRELGLLGIALAALMDFSGILAAIVSLQESIAAEPEIARQRTALGFSAMIMFTTFVSLGIANLRRPEVHRRLMVLAAFSIIQAAIARLIRIPVETGFVERTIIGAVIVDLLLLGVVLLDRRASRRLHPVWIAGFALLVTMQCLRVVIAPTAAWVDFTDWLAVLGH